VENASHRGWFRRSLAFFTRRWQKTVQLKWRIFAAGLTKQAGRQTHEN
jgi:hypothetical protein